MDRTLSSPGAVGPRRWLVKQLSSRADSMSPGRSAIIGWAWRLLTVQRNIYPGDHCFCPRAVGVVDFRKDSAPGDRNLSSPGTHGSTSHSSSAISRWGRGSTSCGAVSTRGIAVFISDCSGVLRRLRRDLGGSMTGIFRFSTSLLGKSQQRLAGIR